MDKFFSGSLKEQESEDYRVNRQKRNRRPGGGQKGVFSNVQDKLFFILYYLTTWDIHLISVPQKLAKMLKS